MSWKLLIKTLVVLALMIWIWALTVSIAFSAFAVAELMSVETAYLWARIVYWTGIVLFGLYAVKVWRDEKKLDAELAKELEDAV